MAQLPGTTRLHIVNPGFNRDGLTTPAKLPRMTGVLAQPVSDIWPEDPWAHLQWWESPLQAQAGIRALCAKPFCSLKGLNEKRGYVPTQLLYADALRSSEHDRIDRAGYSIAANIRQARELYVAARLCPKTHRGDGIGLASICAPRGTAVFNRLRKQAVGAHVLT